MHTRRRLSRLHGVFLCLGLLAVSAAVSAQDSQSPSPVAKPSPSPAAPQEIGENEVLRIDANLVTVPVKVLNPAGNVIPDLRREDFRLFEDGVEQQVVHFEATEQAYTVALVIGVSGAMKPYLKEVQDAACAFVDRLLPADRVMLISFNDVGPEVVVGATRDRDKVKKAIGRLKVSDGTRVITAVQKLMGWGRMSVHSGPVRRAGGRRAVVLFTDGVNLDSVDDRLAYESYEASVMFTEDLGVPIYPIRFNPAADAQPPTADAVAQYRIASGYTYLRDLAQRSGGSLQLVGSAGELKSPFVHVAQELHNQYTLSYYPATRPQPGERRTLKVEVKHAGLTALSRDHYGAGGAGSDGDAPSPERQQQGVKRKDLAALHTASGEWGVGGGWEDLDADAKFGPFTPPFTSGDIALKLTSIYIKEPEGKSAIGCFVHIDAAGLTFADEPGGWKTATARVYAAAYNGDFITGATAATLTIRGRAERLAEILREGGAAHLTVPTKASGMHQLRVIVQDAASGRSAYAAQFIRIPNLPQKYLALSGVVLSGESPVSPAGAGGGGDAGAGDAVPRDVQSGPAMRRFNPGSTLNYSYLVYNAVPKKGEFLETDLWVERRGKKVLQEPTQRVQVGRAEETERLLVSGTLRLKPELGPGYYVMRIVVRDKKSGWRRSPAGQWIDFVIAE